MAVMTRFGVRSITARLVAGFAAAYILVLVPVAVFQYRSLSDELHRSDAETLRGKLKVVEHIVGETAVTDDVSSLKHHLDDALIGHDDLSVWLFDSGGRLLYGASAMPTVRAGKIDGQVSIERADGVVLDGVRRRWARGDADIVREGLIGLDTRPRQRLLALQGQSIAWIGGAGLLVAILLGTVVAAHGLRPIRRLSREASKINAGSPTQRLSRPTDNAELEGLVSAFNGVLDRMSAIYRQMEAFNADVAHELRTPLANLISGFELAVSGDRSPTEIRDAMADGLEELQSMKTLINDMLFVARADEGERATDRQAMSLAAEVQGTVEYFDASLEERKLSVRVDDDATVQGNVRLVRRAVANLLSNAIKFASEDSAIVVFIEAQDREVWVKVSNRGPRVPQDVLDRMFVRFFRGDPSRAATGESHGLGLAIVKAIAQMHDGDVSAESVGDTTIVGFSIRRFPDDDHDPAARVRSDAPSPVSPR